MTRNTDTRTQTDTNTPLLTYIDLNSTLNPEGCVFCYEYERQTVIMRKAQLACNKQTKASEISQFIDYNSTSEKQNSTAILHEKREAARVLEHNVYTGEC